MAPATKNHLRDRILRLRRGLDPGERLERSRAVQERFLAQTRYRTARTVALYAAFRGEVRTEDIFRRAREDGKRICFPRVISGAEELEFHEVNDLDDLQKGTFGIPEPKAAAPPVAPGEIDLVAVPGVAFDADLRRLGMGKGFYDRLLVPGANRPGWAIGIAYDFQVVDHVPTHDGDVPVDQLITESRAFPLDGPLAAG